MYKFAIVFLLGMLFSVSAWAESASYSTTELQPLAVEVSALGQAVPDMLPPGAKLIYSEDYSRQFLTWVPSLGQAGSYRVDFMLPDLSMTEAYIEVKKADLSAGPAGKYRDDLVGYVFIHGLTQENLCKDKKKWKNGEQYWSKETLNYLAPNKAYRNVVCYNGTDDVRSQAENVAQQIKAANCGPGGKCIAITHSMGGLIMEHILLYSDRNVQFAEAKDKILFVISLASAAGGSKTADIVKNGGNFKEDLVRAIADEMDLRSQATDSVVVKTATRELAPIDLDPGVPIFMVPGFSGEIAKKLSEARHSDSDRFDGDKRYSLVDYLTDFKSRSDGLVPFSSSCGIATSDKNDGPGRSKDLGRHFEYCYRETKKPSHQVWFLSRANHSDITSEGFTCKKHGKKVNCPVYFPNAWKATFGESSSYYKAFEKKMKKKANAIRTIRYLLTKDL